MEWILSLVLTSYEMWKLSHGSLASFSCLTLFSHLLLKIQNSFLFMC